MSKKPDFVNLANDALRKYPEATKSRIYLRVYQPLDHDEFMACGLHNEDLRTGEFDTYIDPVMGYADPEASKGCLSHEFAHITTWIRRGYLWTLRYFNTPSSEQEIEEEEIKIDLMVIERGLGWELLRFHRFADQVIALGLKSGALSGGGLPTEHLEYILKADGRLPHPLAYHDYCRIFGSSH